MGPKTKANCERRKWAAQTGPGNSDATLWALGYPAPPGLLGHPVKQAVDAQPP
jgi:hypothetical protein